VGAGCDSVRMAARQLLLKHNEPVARDIRPSLEAEPALAPDERLPVVSVDRFLRLAARLESKFEFEPISLALRSATGEQVGEDEVALLIDLLQQDMHGRRDSGRVLAFLEAYLIESASFAAPDGRRMTLSRRGRIEASPKDVDELASLVVSAWAP
jgi:hypothetical protein